MDVYTVNYPGEQLERAAESPIFLYLHKTEVRLYIYVT